MPSDFGDESGEKLFDWMLRLGEEAGQAAMARSAARIAMAFRNATGEISRSGVNAARTDSAKDAPEWAKLNLHEFKDLPEFETIKQVIDKKLDREALQHEFYDEGEKSYLIFKVDDAPEVSRCFNELADATTHACKEAERKLATEKGREPRAKDAIPLKEADKEPLRDRADAFKKSAELAQNARGINREIVDRARAR